jgi:hypothetical protein
MLLYVGSKQVDTNKMFQMLAIGTKQGNHLPWQQTFADNKFQTQIYNNVCIEKNPQYTE